MLKNDLENLGLNKNEVATYLALQEMGKAKAGELIKETGLHRNLIYQALDALVSRRLASKLTTGSVALFQSTDPSHLLDSVREQELTAQRVIEELKEKKKIVDQEMTIYEGAEGMRAFSLRVAENLESGEVMYVLGSGGRKYEKAMGMRALKKFYSSIEQQGRARVLMYQTQQYTPEMYAFTRGKPQFDLRVLPYNLTPSAGILFTNHTIGFLLFEDPTAVIEIKNPHLIEAYRHYFELLWNQQVRIEEGEDAIKRVFMQIMEELKTGDEYYAIGTQTGEEGSELARFFEQYHKARVQKGITCKLLSYKQDTQTLRVRFHKAGDLEGKISHIRSLPRTVAGFIQTILYNNKVIIPLYGDCPMVITFENKQLYEGFKQYFDELWNQTTQIFEGKDSIVALREAVLEEGRDLFVIADTGLILHVHADDDKIFTQRRVESGIHLYVLANASIRGSVFIKLPDSTISYLPSEFESPMAIWVFGDFVASVLGQESQKIFLTKDKVIAEAYRAYYTKLQTITK